METDVERRQANEQVLLRFFRCLNDRDYEAALELLADDLLWEMPFAPPAFPAPFKLARFSKLLRGFATVFSEGLTFHEVDIEPLLDPDRFVVEFRGEAVVAATGQPYRQRYVGLFRLSEGRIVHVREYFDSAWPSGPWDGRRNDPGTAQWSLSRTDVRLDPVPRLDPRRLGMARGEGGPYSG